MMCFEEVRRWGEQAALLPSHIAPLPSPREHADTQLMAAAKAYRNALLAMSSATAAFASAMEACSR
jgi:hypothetical protein